MFESVSSRVDENLGILRVSYQRPLKVQKAVTRSIEEIARTNKDFPLIKGEVGVRIGFVPEPIVREDIPRIAGACGLSVIPEARRPSKSRN